MQKSIRPLWLTVSHSELLIGGTEPFCLNKTATLSNQTQISRNPFQYPKFYKMWKQILLNSLQLRGFSEAVCFSGTKRTPNCKIVFCLKMFAMTIYKNLYIIHIFLRSLPNCGIALLIILLVSWPGFGFCCCWAFGIITLAIISRGLKMKSLRPIILLVTFTLSFSFWQKEKKYDTNCFWSKLSFF